VVTIDSSGLLTFTGAGSTTITVSQQATETQLAPAPATATVTVNKAASTALSAQPVSVTYGDAPQTLKVNGGNGGEKSYSSDNP
ncbi:hypothetical protein AB1287_22345, partial [Enterobacter asburiae]|uniref:hypothetical protein n=1 Tax=Scandinavium sp. UTDF21-P1B TaxID=3446379 RepID=UPI00347812D7